MNINELIKDNNNNTEIKENVIKNLENTALKIKAENRLAELDKKSEEITKILEKFSEKIPIMINRIEDINNELKLETFYKTLKNIDNYSKEIINVSKIISENNKSYEKKVLDIAEKQISITTQKASSLIYKHDSFSFLVDKGILFGILIIFIINISMMLFYKKQLNQIDYEFNKIHNVLINDQKYWIDKNNYDIFIQHSKKQK